jgi:hypothetical protein
MGCSRWRKVHVEVKFSFGIHAMLCAYGKQSQIWIGVLGWKDLRVWSCIGMLFRWFVGFPM